MICSVAIKMTDHSGDAERRGRFEREALLHLDAIYSAALRLTRDPEGASDLMQETYLRAWRFFDQFSPGSNCRAWLTTILYNAFRNGYRRAAIESVAPSAEEFERRVEEESLKADPCQTNPESLLLGQVMESEVVQALDELPEEFRDALVMIDMQELSYQEAAQVLEIPIGTVKSRISRARAMLRVALRDTARIKGARRA